MKQRGFTLIELLVVISIIGLLASVVTVSLNGARVKARNVRRVSDFRQLQKAFNLAYDSSATGFPSTGGSWVCVSASCYGAWSSFTANATVDAFFTPYMQKPSDPLDNTRGYGGYLYINQWTGGTSSAGVVFPAGAYLHWLAEQPPTTDICAGTPPWSTAGSIVQCLVKID